MQSEDHLDSVKQTYLQKCAQIADAQFQVQLLNIFIDKSWKELASIHENFKKDE